MALICDPIISAALTGKDPVGSTPIVDVAALQAEIEALRAQIVTPIEVAPVVDEVIKPAPKTK